MDWLHFYKKKPHFKSAINGEITLGNRYGQPAVLTGNITQSGGELVRMWDSLLEKEKQNSRAVTSAILLGVAGGMILRLINKYYPKAVLTGVEIDPVMIQIAKSHFDLRQELPVTIIEDDAIEYVGKEKKVFDLIAVDLYIKELNAPGTRDIKFMVGLRKILSKKGVLLYNVHYQKENPEDYTEFVRLCNKLFSSVEEVYSYPLNRILKITHQ